MFVLFSTEDSRYRKVGAKCEQSGSKVGAKWEQYGVSSPEIGLQESKENSGLRKRK